MSTASSPSYSFFYDAFGRRESFDDFGIVTSYIYDTLLAVQTSSNTSPASSQNFFTTPGGDVLAYQETSGSTTNTFVPLTDVLGSTLGLVNSSGSIASSWKYEPFGVPTPSGQASKYQYLFAGMEYDPTGLDHTYARYYSPRLQRFLSEDPLQFGGGDVNLFAYTGNDPVNEVDPLGLDYNAYPGPEGGMPTQRGGTISIPTMQAGIGCANLGNGCKLGLSAQPGSPDIAGLQGIVVAQSSGLQRRRHRRRKLSVE